MTVVTEMTFAKLTDRTRMDRLQGEILAFVSDFEERGYHNMDIARELVAAGFLRVRRENSSVRESFHQHVRDASIQYLAGMREISRKFTERLKKGH